MGPSIDKVDTVIFLRSASKQIGIAHIQYLLASTCNEKEVVTTWILRLRIGRMNANLVWDNACNVPRYCLPSIKVTYLIGKHILIRNTGPPVASDSL